MLLAQTKRESVSGARTTTKRFVRNELLIAYPRQTVSQRRQSSYIVSCWRRRHQHFAWLDLTWSGGGGMESPHPSDPINRSVRNSRASSKKWQRQQQQQRRRRRVVVVSSAWCLVDGGGAWSSYAIKHSAKDLIHLFIRGRHKRLSTRDSECVALLLTRGTKCGLVILEILLDKIF